LTQRKKEKVKEVVGDILKTVQGGGYLSDAMAKHPKNLFHVLREHGEGG